MNLTNEQKFTLIGLGLAIMVGILVYAYNHFLSPETPDFESEAPKAQKTVSQILVHIAGEVCRPGVYRVNRGDRVLDAVKLAGGQTSYADLEIINLAQILKDGDKIEIPSKYGRNKAQEESSDGKKSKKTKKKKPEKTKASEEDQAKVKISFPININTATTAQLDALPKIGPSTAEKIVEYRKANGAFTKLEDIMKVERIGKKTFEKLKEKITL